MTVGFYGKIGTLLQYNKCIVQLGSPNPKTRQKKKPRDSLKEYGFLWFSSPALCIACWECSNPGLRAHSWLLPLCACDHRLCSLLWPPARGWLGAFAELGWGRWDSCYDVHVKVNIKVRKRSKFFPRLNCVIGGFYFRHPVGLTFLPRTTLSQAHTNLVVHLLPVITQPPSAHQTHSQESSYSDFVWNQVNSITFPRCVCNLRFLLQVVELCPY